MPLEEPQAGPYASFDPDEVRPKTTGGSPLGPLRDAAGEPLPSFDERYAEEFSGLLYLGALSKEFYYLGHRFVIRTLNDDEYLTIPLIMRPWQGTIGESKAYHTACVALSIISVDGQRLPTPVAESPDGDIAWATQRFNFVKGNWFGYTIDKVYSEFRVLEAKAQEVIEAMEKAYGPTDSMAGSNATSAGPSDGDS